MSYLARLKAKIGENRAPDELTELTKGASVSFVSNQGGPFLRNRRGSDGLPDCNKIETGSEAAATVIDIADHFAKAQRIADRKNADAARLGQTDRWCACDDYAPHAWRIGGREVWLCPKCEKERRL